MASVYGQQVFQTSPQYVQQGPVTVVSGGEQVVYGQPTTVYQPSSGVVYGGQSFGGSNFVGGATQQVLVGQPTTTVLQSAPATVLGGQSVVVGGAAGQQLIKGESRIEYIPFEQRVTDYETREWIETIPKQRVVTEYQERRWVETVPREVTKIDYYAIEHIKKYIPEVIPETTIETVPVERVVQRTEYIPVEKKTVHYPQAKVGTERHVVLDTREVVSSVAAIPAQTYQTVTAVPTQTYQTVTTAPQTYQTVTSVPQTYQTVTSVPQTYQTVTSVPQTTVVQGGPVRISTVGGVNAIGGGVTTLGGAYTTQGGYTTVGGSTLGGVTGLTTGTNLGSSHIAFPQAYSYTTAPTTTYTTL